MASGGALVKHLSFAWPKPPPKQHHIDVSSGDDDGACCLLFAAGGGVGCGAQVVHCAAVVRSFAAASALPTFLSSLPSTFRD